MLKPPAVALLSLLLPFACTTTGHGSAWLAVCACEGDAPARPNTQTLSVSNRSATPVHVLGFRSLHDPVARIEFSDGGRWIDITPTGGCGAGLLWNPLAPGESATFTVRLRLEDNPERSATRVGLIWREHPGDFDGNWQVAWSSPFVPEPLRSEEELLAWLLRRAAPGG